MIGSSSFYSRRSGQLIARVVDELELDLKGLTILTEAATGHYACSPVIAAIAGAERVIAVTRQSSFGSVAEVQKQTAALASAAGAPPVIEVHTQVKKEEIARADIVTNLGFVRPINREFVEAMKDPSVVCLMCEAWEMRPADVDGVACQDRGIPLLATNESLSEFDIFSYCGVLVAKLLLEAMIEIQGSNIVVLGTDKFADVTEKHLVRVGAKVQRVAHLRAASPDSAAVDAIVIADYTRTDAIVGSEGDLTAKELTERFPSATVVHLAGIIDTPGLTGLGVPVHPSVEIGPRQMTKTLAHLGPLPVIKLHAAGMRVGQWAISQLKSGTFEMASVSERFPLAQSIPEQVMCE